jgi:hypothetical protein
MMRNVTARTTTTNGNKMKMTKDWESITTSGFVDHVVSPLIPNTSLANIRWMQPTQEIHR